MLSRRPLFFGPLILAILGATGQPLAQQPMGHEQDVIEPVPPPVPVEEEDDDKAGLEYEPIAPQSDQPWGLAQELLGSLFERARLYAEYTNRFTCDETARLADYNSSGEVTSERRKRYAYTLLKDTAGETIREHRQELSRSGSPKRGAVEDEEPFPPAYAWVFLFSRFNEPYFAFRYLEERFDGFDWVYEIQFKGAVRFTDGKDIRQWEGTVILDAVTHTPLEIRAEPTGQQDRIEALYRQYMGSFNIIGIRTKPKPRGFRAEIQFRNLRDKLTFPTQLRYDTFQAVSPTQVVPVRASTRGYSRYRIIEVTMDQTVGETIDK